MTRVDWPGQTTYGVKDEALPIDYIYGSVTTLELPQDEPKKKRKKRAKLKAPLGFQPPKGQR